MGGGVGMGMGKHFPNRRSSVCGDQRSRCQQTPGRAEHQAMETMGKWEPLQGSKGFIRCHDQICILKGDFSCYGNWGEELGQPHGSRHLTW